MATISAANALHALGATLVDLPRVRRQPAPRDHDLDAIVVGSGFAGMGMAHHLRRQGVDVTILERGHAVGGTWRDNTYPGAACDIPAHLYSFSFAPKADWTTVYPKQPEIRAYLEECADRLDLRDAIVFGAEVTRCRWDERDQRWRVTTSDGRERVARLLVGAFGPLANPAIPDLPGRDDFEGPQFHSATWDHDVDLAGRRVVVVGTGASAIQFVPEIAPRAARTTVVQRTAPWVIPRLDRTFHPVTKWLLLHVPGLRALYRAAVYAQKEIRFVGFVGDGRLMRASERVAHWHRRRALPRSLHAATRPDHPMGCKRILISNDWYPTLAREDVDLVTSPVARVTRDGVVLADGTQVRADALIWGTGFAVQDPLGDCEVVGSDGQALREAWSPRPRAHLGTTVPGFPNLFLLLGPNTGLGHNSMVHVMESQFAYVGDAVRQMAREGIATVEVRRDVFDAFQDELDRRHADTVWSSGCDSWYLKDGENFTLWPGFTFEYRQRTARFDLDDHVVALPRVREDRVAA